MVGQTVWMRVNNDVQSEEESEGRTISLSGASCCAGGCRRSGAELDRCVMRYCARVGRTSSAVGNVA